MRAFIMWGLLCGCILTAALYLKSVPQHVQGAGFMLALFLVTAGLMVKFTRGSR